MKRLRSKHSRGFTLLELLVAIAILALIAVGAYKLLVETIANRDRGMQQERSLQALQRAEMLMQRDLLQAVARSVRDEFGDAQPGFWFPQENVMEFTRRGWRNPLQEARSDLVRVRYRLANGQLIRERWQVLDRARTSVPEKIVLLDHVDAFQLQVFAEGNWGSTWPLLGQTPQEKQNLPLPAAVEIRLTLQPWGEIRRVIALPESETDAKPLASN